MTSKNRRITDTKQKVKQMPCKVGQDSQLNCNVNSKGTLHNNLWFHYYQKQQYKQKKNRLVYQKKLKVFLDSDSNRTPKTQMTEQK